MPKTIVVMPAYNAEATLEKTYQDIPKAAVSGILLGDDCSGDRTVAIAQKLGIEVLKTPYNLGYGANQKMLYKEALRRGADIIVMLHPDWQYDAAKIPEMIDPIISGEKDFMMGSRISEAKSNMPLYKYISNRFLSFVEERTFQLHLSEYHSGFRAYSRQLLETIPYLKNSNDFVFDTEVLAQIALFGFTAGEISVPCRYFAEASEINFWRSSIYGLQTLLVCFKFVLYKLGLKPFAPPMT